MDHRPSPLSIRWYIRYFKATLLNTTAYIAAVDAQTKQYFFLISVLKPRFACGIKKLRFVGKVSGTPTYYLSVTEKKQTDNFLICDFHDQAVINSSQFSSC